MCISKTVTCHYVKCLFPSVVRVALTCLLETVFCEIDGIDLNILRTALI
jgi:hypothetical protein